jgi:hypothetical protein
MITISLEETSLPAAAVRSVPAVLAGMNGAPSKELSRTAVLLALAGGAGGAVAFACLLFWEPFLVDEPERTLFFLDEFPTTYSFLICHR